MLGGGLPLRDRLFFKIPHPWLKYSSRKPVRVCLCYTARSLLWLCIVCCTEEGRHTERAKPLLLREGAGILRTVALDPKQWSQPQGAYSLLFDGGQTHLGMRRPLGLKVKAL